MQESSNDFDHDSERSFWSVAEGDVKVAGRKAIVVSFDYDGTTTVVDSDSELDAHGFPRGQLNVTAAELMCLHAKRGDKVVIVTARTEDALGEVWKMVKDNGLPVHKVYATSLKAKSPTLNSIGASIHYDDNPFVVDEVRQSLGSKVAVYFDTDMETNLKAESQQ